MLTVSIGPLAFAFDHLLWLLCLVTIGLVADRVAVRDTARAASAGPAPDASRLLWPAALIGLVVARLGFVVQEFELYRADPAALLDLRDGGYLPVWGWLALLGVLLWQGWREPVLRRALVAGVLAAGWLWAGVQAALGRQEGALRPALSLQTLTGESVELATLAAGVPTVVNLWATWCPPCRKELPAFAAVQQREPGVRLLLVNQGEDAATVQTYLASQGLAPQDVLLDRHARLGPLVGSSGLPTTLFYDASGRLVDRHLGPLSAITLTSRVRALAR